MRVTLDKQANVKMVDGNNFWCYKNGEEHQYYGDLAGVSPINLRPPYRGRWHATVDLGRYTGTINAFVGLV